MAVWNLLQLNHHRSTKMLLAGPDYCTTNWVNMPCRSWVVTGDPQAAISTLERYLSTPYLWRYETDAVELGWAMKRLEDLYEQRGQAQKAAAVRARLLRLWHRADPELQPVLAEVRARLGA